MVKTVLFFLLFTLFFGCNSNEKLNKKNNNSNFTSEKEEFIEMDEVIISKSNDIPKDVNDMFKEANKLFTEERYEEALTVYQNLKDLNAKNSILANYNIAVTLTKLKKIEEALLIYEELLKIENLDEELYIDTIINISEIYGYQKEWEKTENLLKYTVENNNFKNIGWDYIEISIRYQVALFNLGYYDDSEFVFLKAIQTYKQNKNRFVTLSLKQRYFLSMGNFYNGEVNRIKFENIKITGDVKGMGKILDEKADILLSAQNYYINSIDFKDKYWATASGYKIGEMYEKYYEQIMNTELPAKLTFEEETIYKEELQKRIQILLKKAINIFEENIKMSERVSEKNIWVEKTLEKLKEVKAKYIKIKESEVESYENN